MGSLLVHVTHGPEAPSRAALGVTVAKAGIDAGHEVTLFLAGDAAYLVKDAVIENLQGIGTGALRETLPALVEAGASIFVSGMSSKSRGVSEEDLAGKGIEFAGPPQLVDLTFEADRVLCY
jgi:predicted peroxiredoxin